MQSDSHCEVQDLGTRPFKHVSLFVGGVLRQGARVCLVSWTFASNMCVSWSSKLHEMKLPKGIGRDVWEWDVTMIDLEDPPSNLGKLPTTLVGSTRAQKTERPHNT